MADEQDKWLNRETAERLLRGESLEAVDACARDQAERLSRALGALSAQAAPAPGELPGEQAALAAFRKAREAAGAERAAVGRAAGTAGRPVPGADAGLVRIGAPACTGIPVRRPRWARPVRLALAAAMAVGTLGGVAMAAGTGILPTPFGPERPGPAASVSAGQSSAGPSASASPQGTPSSTAGPGLPSGSPGANRGGASGQAAGPDDRPGASTAPGSGDSSGTWWKDATAACRDIRDGKGLDAGRRRALENLAGGSARLSQYCKVLLTAAQSADGAANGGKGAGSGDNGEGGKGKDKGKGNGNGQGGDDEGHPGRGGGDGHPGWGGGDGHPGWGGGDGHPGWGGGDGHSGKGGDGKGDDGKGGHGRGVASVPSAFAPAHPARKSGTALGPTPSPSPAHSAP
ncbi:hypothetical protein BFF78_16655 [Streptomyces fodineus]|uniref:Extensin n=1 Tax=Streptomyces fodineus TaxID=1904616 RepID=A0A1D7YA13_9ACTN|nr:hypothetical protein [Streptomyces fodineus]AOR32477.1 hypothetical protein BFF78_16655 [Streptomyces fodineus]